MPAKAQQRIRFGGRSFFPIEQHGPTIIPDDLLAAYPAAAKKEIAAGRIKMVKVKAAVAQAEAKALEDQERGHTEPALVDGFLEMEWQEARDIITNVVDGVTLNRYEVLERERGERVGKEPRPSVLKAIDMQRRQFASIE